MPTWALVIVSTGWWFLPPSDVFNVPGYQNRADCETAREIIAAQMDDKLRRSTAILCIPPAPIKGN